MSQSYAQTDRYKNIYIPRDRRTHTERQGDTDGEIGRSTQKDGKRVTDG